MSLILEIKNSFITIKNADSFALEVIKQTLTYDDQEVIFTIQNIKQQMFSILARHKRNRVFPQDAKRLNYYKWQLDILPSQIKRCWLMQDRFPTGHLGLVVGALEANNLPLGIEDVRNRPKGSAGLQVVNEPPPLRYYQGEMLELAKKEHRGVFEAAVGSGKTLVMQSIARELNVPTLIVTPSKDLAVQTIDSFKEIFGDQVVLLSGTLALEKLKPIRVVTVQTLASLKKKEKLAPYIADIGLLCIDETHHSGARTYTDLLLDFDHIYYRFGFSGTFMRNDSKTLDMWGFLSTVLYRYGAGKATEEGFLTPMVVKVHDIPGVKKPKYPLEYTENYCNNPKLLGMISNIIRTETESGDQILILVKQKEAAGKIISEYLLENGVENRFISGDNKKADIKAALKAFNDKEVQVLIGSTIIGEGIDIRSTDHLIMAQGGKSEIAITQAVGRAVRLFPDKTLATVHDFNFLKTKYLRKHLDERLKIYKKNFSGKVEL